MVVKEHQERKWHSYDKELLGVHVKEIARILYKNTPSCEIETFEGIETTVRDQVLEHVSPKIAFFLSEKKRERQRGKHGL